MKIPKNMLNIDNASKTEYGFMSAQDKEYIDKLKNSNIIDNNGNAQFITDAPVNNAYYIRRNNQWELLDINNLIDNVNVQPNKPTIISPFNGENDINQIPQITGSEYISRFGINMVARKINIATDENFENIVYNIQENSNSTIWRISLKEDNTSYLLPNTTYYVRIAYMDKRGTWSDWSNTNNFITKEYFDENILMQPILIAPADNGYITSINPTLLMSAPQILQGIANFTKSDWQIASDPTFTQESMIYEALNQSDSMTQHICRNLNLSASTIDKFYCRARQGTDTGAYTAWTNTHTFSLRTEYNNPIFGIRKIFSTKMSVPLCYNIDENGEYLQLTKSYFDNHPLYQFTTVTIDISPENNYSIDMLFIPPCWMKHNVYDNEEGDLVVDIWYSPILKEGDGWQLDPAFRKSPEGFYITYRCADSDGVNINGIYYPSLVGGSDYFDNNLYSITPLQNNFDNTFHFPTVYEIRLLNDLSLSESLHNIYNANGAATYREFSTLFYDSYPSRNHTHKKITHIGYEFKLIEIPKYVNISNITIKNTNPEIEGTSITLGDIDYELYKAYPVINNRPVISKCNLYEPSLGSYKGFDIVLNNFTESYKITAVYSGGFTNYSSPEEFIAGQYNGIVNASGSLSYSTIYFKPKRILRGYDDVYGFDLAIMGIPIEYDVTNSPEPNNFAVNNTYMMRVPSSFTAYTNYDGYCDINSNSFIFLPSVKGYGAYENSFSTTYYTQLCKWTSAPQEPEEQSSN